MRAVVTHRSAGGVGVMLTVEDPEYSRFDQEAIEPGRSPRHRLSGGDGADWSRLRGGGGGVLVLRIGERLDLSATELVQRAIRFIASATAPRIGVDLGATRRVFDSGLGLLLLLSERAGRLGDRICLASCAPEVRGRLSSEGIASRFRLI